MKGPADIIHLERLGVDEFLLDGVELEDVCVGVSHVEDKLKKLFDELFLDTPFYCLVDPLYVEVVFKLPLQQLVLLLLMRV